MKKLLIGILLFGLVIFGAAFGGAYYFQHRLNNQKDEQIENIAKAALTSLKEQPRLTPFTARFAAVVTSQLTADTMIVPGLVRYELDLNAIRPQDVKWDKDAEKLTVRLPALILSGPTVELNGIRKYGPGGMAMALGNAGNALDDASRKEAKAKLLEQAIDDASIRMAKDAARHVVERSFAMPLRTAGIKTKVEVKFVGEQDDAQSEEQVEGL